MDKKGFTLVELLAVIVILAIVMLVAVTSIGPMMAKSKKSALGSEGLALIKAAKEAYAIEDTKGSAAQYTLESNVCYNVKYLCENGYFEKGCGDDGYTGSVLVKYDDTTENYEYYFWLSNGTYSFNAATEATYGDIENTTIVYEGVEASTDCGKTTPSTVPSEVKTDITNNNNNIANNTTSVVTFTETTTGGTTTWTTNAPANVIHFTINSIDYTANKNMIWEEWINSEYNDIGYGIVKEDNIGVETSTDCGNYVYDDLGDVHKTDMIVANYNYGIGIYCTGYFESIHLG